MTALWLKALHLIFMVTWFAGIFYLPRLFIYHVESSDDASHRRFQTMERKLFVLMTIGAVLTIAFGIATLSTTAFRGVIYQGWMHAKLLLIVGLLVFHVSCWRWIGRLARGEKPASTTGLRWYNEIPVLFLFGIVILAVVRPF